MMSVDFVVVIPARFASSRLPGKPLADLGGKPMIVRVAEAALLSQAKQVVIATDDQRIQAAVNMHLPDVTVCLTKADHVSGTDRLAEVAEQLQWPASQIVVNLQGDEPFMPPDWLNQVAALLNKHPNCQMATFAHHITDPNELANPNIVKVACRQDGRALYFSRAPIPYQRDIWLGLDQITQVQHKQISLLRHIGLYAYRTAFLRQFPQLMVSPLETQEMLEQLRALWHGYDIAVGVQNAAPQGGIDTTDDLLRAQTWYTQQI